MKRCNLIDSARASGRAGKNRAGTAETKWGTPLFFIKWRISVRSSCYLSSSIEKHVFSTIPETNTSHDSQRFQSRLKSSAGDLPSPPRTRALASSASSLARSRSSAAATAASLAAASLAEAASSPPRWASRARPRPRSTQTCCRNRCGARLVTRPLLRHTSTGERFSTQDQR